MANANYLPVLIVSVNTNAAPDDTTLVTLPRAQVDYLSHEWQEEDVWRSWRKMTRQKNEIANGIRLENASWRTWWKQRNKLKTVTPETLNWLKDSDVTWLYGPLHTADDDKPPPKPPGITDNASRSGSNQLTPSGYPSRTTKPILKYRSISELLTSDLPNSPVFSPADSDDEHDSRYDPQLDAISADRFALPSPTPGLKRPKLQHTKSDTHITRWGPSRAFRKDSPPRIEPPGHNDESYFPKVSAAGPVRTSLSQDSNSSAGTSTNGEKAAKKKHITFNTFVEQVIAIDKPKRSASFYTIPERTWDSRREYDDDDGYEEDQEDSAEEEACIEDPWSHPRIRTTGIHGYNSPDDMEEEEDDGTIEMRSSFRHATPKKGPRSQSKASNTSSSSSVSTASSTTYSTTNSSSSPSRDSASLSSVSTARRKPLTRRTSSSTYRPQLVRPPPEHVHVTIAPIAPTVLKTTDMWEEGFGDEGAGSDDGFGWGERLWGYNDNAKSKCKRRKEDEGSDASGTPVELVYVPPFNSRFSYEQPSYGDLEEDDEYDEDYGGLRSFGDDDEELEEEDYASSIVHSRPSYRRDDSNSSDIYLHRGTAAGSVGFEDYGEGIDKHLHGSPVPGIPIPIPANSADELDRMGYVGLSTGNVQASIPKLVVEKGKVNPNVNEEDEADFFDGDPDYGNEYMGPVHRPGRPGYGASSRFMIGSDERPSRSTSRTRSSRSRSKSHSRTPSPAMESISPSAVDPESIRRSYSSASPSPNFATHLLPPVRGRSHQDILQSSSRSQAGVQSSSRGRSTTRTSGSSSLESSTSPFEGMSPDSASSRYGSSSAYAGGGRMDREPRDRDRTGGERRGREPVRERERGRDRTTDKRLSVSLSNSPEPPRGSRSERESSSSVTTASTATTASAGVEMDASFVSSGSSTSSNKTVIPQEQASQGMTEEDYQREAAEFLRRSGPTPSNSPVIEMKAPPVPEALLSSEQGTPTPLSIAAASSSSTAVATPTATKFAPASSVSPTSTKAKPPPLIPSPSSPAQPSTSYTAVSSPSPTNVKVNPSPSRLITSATPTNPTSVPSEILGNRQRSPAGRAGRSKSPQSDTLMGKAAEIAGAFFGLWNSSTPTTAATPTS